MVNRKLIAWVFVLTGLVSGGAWVWGRTRLAAAPASAAQVKSASDSWWGPVKITYTINPPSPSPFGQRVLAQLQTQLATASGEYGIYVYRLPDKGGYGLAADQVFRAASIMKVPFMVAAYRKVEDGTIKIDDVESLLQAMGKQSDNDAPVTLADLVGRPFVSQTTADLGMLHTDFATNTTTASDVALMWKNLYQGKLLTPDHWQQMQQFLTDTIFEDRIPAGVPDGVRVVHKIGTDQDVWADAGIVMAPRPFVIVILNSGVDLAEAGQLVPELVKTIWLAETSGPR